MTGKWNCRSEPAANFDATLDVQRRVGEAVSEHRRRVMLEEEEEIRRLLGHWVSGLTPAVVRNSGGGIVGLCDADAPIGSSPFVFYRH